MAIFGVLIVVLNLITFATTRERVSLHPGKIRHTPDCEMFSPAALGS